MERSVVWQRELFELLEVSGDEKQANRMSVYMQNRFGFLGIPKPMLKKLAAPFLKQEKGKLPDWEFVYTCWEKNYREAQYVALTYLQRFAEKLTKEDLTHLRYLITHRSWWETVDNIDALVGGIVQRNPELEPEMIGWSRDENLWIRRVSIDFQQKYKEKTNAKLLAEIICNNLGSTEFFINKAIGWSLRDYAKVNPEWVREFLKVHGEQMDKVSLKEVEQL